jgi:hypothetical protein
MVARARKPEESFPHYKQNLKEEADTLKAKLKPKKVWQATGPRGNGTYNKTTHGSL